MTKSFPKQADIDFIPLNNRAKDAQMTLRRRKHRRARRDVQSGGRGRYLAAAVCLAVPFVLAATFALTGGVDATTQVVALNVEKRDAAPFFLSNGDDRIARTSVAGNYVNGMGESLDPAAPEQDELMAMSPAELGYNSAEFADDTYASFRPVALEERDPLDWGEVGGDPSWRAEVALFENETASFQDAHVPLWSAAALEAERDLALSSDVLTSLNCRTLVNDDGTPVYLSAELGAESGMKFMNTASGGDSPQVDRERGVTTTEAQAPVVQPQVVQPPVVRSASYFAPSATAWTPNAVTSGSVVHSVVY